MKNLIFIFITVFSLFSCSKNNDDTTPQQTNDLHATWKLIKFEAGFGPTTNYNGEIQWTINSNNSIDVVITNGTQTYPTLPLNTTGNYPYTNGVNTLQLNNNEGWNFEIINNQLIINQNPSADGRRLTFSKIQ